ncbi:hypothetical protein ACFSTA_18785 [Ornithinibacillus salinisoli]|uniref:Uncharacterized protein n=1 Tax=Ornithinibacillus salinisoli TaxID=1848459 RepID=A0ABW4W7T6_9BACI
MKNTRINFIYICFFFVLFIVLVPFSTNKNQNTVESNLLHIVAYILEMHSDETLLYVGESENWEIIFIVNENDNGIIDFIDVFRYRGKIDNSLIKPKNNKLPISYKIYKPGVGTKSGKAFLSEDGTFFGSGGNGSEKYNTKTILKVVIEWDGKEEEIELRYKDTTTVYDLKSM